MYRFYTPDLNQTSIEGAEAKHAHQVLRLRSGDTCTIFDGKGKEAKVNITRINKDILEFSILAISSASEPKVELNLIQAIPKGKAMELILQKATELGIANIYPILSERTVVKIDDDELASKTRKWEHTIIESCKQCGQNILPKIHQPQTLPEFLEADKHHNGLKLIGSLQPDAKELPSTLAHARNNENIKAVYFMVGPEGDFTPAEIGNARSACYIPVSLGPTVLRTETASIFLTSALLYEFILQS